ncbi:MAG: hypothetical protein J3K34DRAFT_518208 [Monoraphidium minutum]|nr:MAG: hypothetical protein J3K34DRAFT_518208 [Monoraphidium minutum]
MDGQSEDAVELAPGEGAVGSGDADAAGAAAWLWGIYRDMRSTSREVLFAYFRGHDKSADLTPEILNLVGRMAKAGFPDHEAASFAPDPAGGGDRMDCALAASYLYYAVCERELARRFPLEPDSMQAARRRRFKGLARVAPDPGAAELLARADFHGALLHCALELTAAVAHQGDTARAFPWMTQRLGRGTMAVSLWAAARSFEECFAPGESRHPLPAAAAALLARLRLAALSGAGLASGGEFQTIAMQGGGYCFADGDPGLAASFYSSYTSHVTAAGLRAGAALLTLRPPPGGGEGAPGGSEYPQQVAELLDELLAREAGLFMGQPAAVMVGCACYVMAKLGGFDTRFIDVEQAVLSTMPGAAPVAFHQAELSPGPPPPGVGGGGGGAALGTMRQFLPCAEDIARAVAAGAAAQLPCVCAPPDHPLAAGRDQQGQPPPAPPPLDRESGPLAIGAAVTAPGRRRLSAAAAVAVAGAPGGGGGGRPAGGAFGAGPFQIIPDDEAEMAEGDARDLGVAAGSQQQAQHSNRLLPARMSLRAAAKPAAAGGGGGGAAAPPGGGAPAEAAAPARGDGAAEAREEQARFGFGGGGFGGGGGGRGGAAPMEIERAASGEQDKENAGAAPRRRGRQPPLPGDQGERGAAAGAAGGLLAGLRGGGAGGALVGAGVGRAAKLAAEGAGAAAAAASPGGGAAARGGARAMR